MNFDAFLDIKRTIMSDYATESVIPVQKDLFMAMLDAMIEATKAVESLTEVVNATKEGNNEQEDQG